MHPDYHSKLGVVVFRKESLPLKQPVNQCYISRNYLRYSNIVMLKRRLNFLLRHFYYLVLEFTNDLNVLSTLFLLSSLYSVLAKE